MFRSKIRVASAALLSVVAIWATAVFSTPRASAAEKPAKACGRRGEIVPPRPKQPPGLKLRSAADEEFARQFINAIIESLALSIPAPPAQPQKSAVHVTAHNNRLTIRTTLNGATLETVTDRATFEVAGLKGQIAAANNRVKFQYAGGDTTGDAEADRASYDNADGAIELEGKVIFNRRSTKGGSTSVAADRFNYNPIKRLVLFESKANISSKKN
jgi:lipopolysaccharide export system protein LptA